MSHLTTPYLSIVALVMRLSETDTDTPSLYCFRKDMSFTSVSSASIVCVSSEAMVDGVNVLHTKHLVDMSSLIDSPSELPQV